MRGRVVSDEIMREPRVEGLDVFDLVDLLGGERHAQSGDVVVQVLKGTDAKKVREGQHRWREEE